MKIKVLIMNNDYLTTDIAGNIIKNSTVLKQLRQDILESHEEMSTIRTDLEKLRIKLKTTNDYRITSDIISNQNSLADLKIDSIMLREKFDMERNKIALVSYVFYAASKQNLEEFHFP